MNAANLIKGNKACKSEQHADDASVSLAPAFLVSQCEAKRMKNHSINRAVLIC